MDKETTPLPRRSIANNDLLIETARLVAEGHTVTLLVRGNSMNPFLHDRRDRVLLSPFSATALRRGDVVLAQCDDGRVVLHRIINRCGDKFLLMGDGNSRGTEHCRIEGVMALVVKVMRNGRYYSCTERTWRTYSAWWMRLRPLHRYLLWGYRRLAGIGAAI